MNLSRGKKKNHHITSGSEEKGKRKKKGSPSHFLTARKKQL